MTSHSPFRGQTEKGDPSMKVNPAPCLLFNIACFAFLLLLVGGPVYAQGPFQHVIIIVQENRSVDNLFQDPVLMENGAEILPGYDVPGYTAGAASCEKGSTYLYPYSLLEACFDPDHLHATAFETSADVNGS